MMLRIMLAGLVVAASPLAAAPAAKSGRAAAPAKSARAAAPAPLPMKCPIGGGEFTFRPTASSSVWGTRGDGRPYGNGTYPLALPECPDNGLVLYKEYTQDEVAKLEPLIASEDFQGLRLLDTQYYRAYWLMKSMGLPPERHLWALLQASWEAEGKPLLRNRYLAELAEESAKARPDPASLNWIGMEGRAVNALRELGRFDEALARLDSIPLASIRAGAEAKPATDESRSKRGWLDFFEAQRVLIARQDVSSDPFELMPKREIAARCKAGKGLDASQKEQCQALAEGGTEADKAKREAAELQTIGKKPVER